MVAMNYLHPEQFKGQLYHGTNVLLGVGDHITPANERGGRVNSGGTGTHTFATPHKGNAAYFAGMSDPDPGDYSHVYEPPNQGYRIYTVAPTGPVERDPNSDVPELDLDKDAVRSQSAMRVTGVVSHKDFNDLLN